MLDIWCCRALFSSHVGLSLLPRPNGSDLHRRRHHHILTLTAIALFDVIFSFLSYPLFFTLLVLAWDHIIVVTSQVALYAKHIGKSPEQIEEDIRRPKYFSPAEAVDYGIIDKVPLHNPYQQLLLLLLLLTTRLCRCSIMKGAKKTGVLFQTSKGLSSYDMDSLTPN